MWDFRKSQQYTRVVVSDPEVGMDFTMYLTLICRYNKMFASMNPVDTDKVRVHSNHYPPLIFHFILSGYPSHACRL